MISKGRIYTSRDQRQIRGIPAYDDMYKLERQRKIELSGYHGWADAYWRGWVLGMADYDLRYALNPGLQSAVVNIDTPDILCRNANSIVSTKGAIMMQSVSILPLTISEILAKRS